MQAAGDRVAAAAEFSAGVEDRQTTSTVDFLFVLDHVDRDAATIVGDHDSAVRAHDDGDRVAVSGESLIDGVVDDLVDEMVQPARTGRSDVHTGALAHRLKSLEDLDLVHPVDVFRGVRGRGFRGF